MLQVVPICFEYNEVLTLQKPYAVLLVTSGEGVIKINDHSVPLVKNRAFLFKAGQQIYVEGSLLIGYLLEFQQLIMDYYYNHHAWQRNVGLFDRRCRLPFIDVGLDDFHFLSHLIFQMRCELEKKSQMPRHYLCMLLKLVNRKAEEQATVMPESEFIMERLLRLLDEHFKEQKSTSFYADKLGITEKKLNRATYKHHGKKFHGVWLSRIVVEADLMLAGSRVSIKEIAQELGFSDQSFFTTYYHREKGITPTEYRAALAE